MEPYAVVETGSKQYLVRVGDTVEVERLVGEPGTSLELRPVLASSNGQELTVGTPALDGAKVTGEIVKHIRGKKIVAFKKKRRKGYHRKIGHRQELTVLRITAVA
jgi:large subunit ribosomal protein L21